MSMLIHEVLAPHRRQTVPLQTRLDRGFACRIDPLLDRALGLARAGAWACNLANDELSWTSGVYDIFGLPTGTVLDRREMVEMYTDQSREEMERLRAQAIARGSAFALDAQIRRADGELRWIRISGEAVRDRRGSAILHGLKQDVTEEKLRAEMLRQMAESDALTGLASRAVYETRFLNTQCNAAPLAPLGALVLFDLDGFKGINDRLGHLAGDACLRAFSHRLAASFPDALLIARIGGDEFAVIASNAEPVETLQARVSRFLVKLRAPIIWREQMFTIGATSGMAIPADPWSYDPEDLFVRADAALYATKRMRRRARASR